MLRASSRYLFLVLRNQGSHNLWYSQIWYWSIYLANIIVLIPRTTNPIAGRMLMMMVALLWTRSLIYHKPFRKACASAWDNIGLPRRQTCLDWPLRCEYMHRSRFLYRWWPVDGGYLSSIIPWIRCPAKNAVHWTYRAHDLRDQPKLAQQFLITGERAE